MPGGDIKQKRMAATHMAKSLIQRSYKTDEVKDIMSGKGFNNKAYYTSKPDILKTEIHHQVLALDSD